MRDVGSLSGLCFPRPKISSSLNHEVKGQFRWCGEQTHETLTYSHSPCRCSLQLETVNIYYQEEEGGAAALG
jgi:hypothetical protein